MKNCEANTPPKFIIKPLSEQETKKIELSFIEAQNLDEREIKCPYCTTPITKVFSDVKGHIRVKCQKCKAVTVINLAYFRKMIGYGQTKISK